MRMPCVDRARSRWHRRIAKRERHNSMPRASEEAARGEGTYARTWRVSLTHGSHYNLSRGKGKPSAPPRRRRLRRRPSLSSPCSSEIRVLGREENVLPPGPFTACVSRAAFPSHAYTNARRSGAARRRVAMRIVIHPPALHATWYTVTRVWAHGLHVYYAKHRLEAHSGRIVEAVAPRPSSEYSVGRKSERKRRVDHEAITVKSARGESSASHACFADSAPVEKTMTPINDNDPRDASANSYAAPRDFFPTLLSAEMSGRGYSRSGRQRYSEAEVFGETTRQTATRRR